MMKPYALIIVIIAYSCSHSLHDEQTIHMNEDSGAEPVSASVTMLASAMEDTIFLHQERTGSCYHTIFIEKDRRSRFHHRLTDFTFNANDEQGYTEALKMFQMPGKVNRNKTDLPRNWLPLYRYQDNYYLYAPSDWGNAGRRMINDSAFVYWYMDGPLPVPLIKVEKRADDLFDIKMVDPADPVAKSIDLSIHIVDREKNVAVFELSNKPEPDRYQLYVSADSAHHFQMIVNHCENQKRLEFTFDSIDYQALLTKP